MLSTTYRSIFHRSVFFSRAANHGPAAPVAYILPITDTSQRSRPISFPSQAAGFSSFLFSLFLYYSSFPSLLSYPSLFLLPPAVESEFCSCSLFMPAFQFLFRYYEIFLFFLFLSSPRASPLTLSSSLLLQHRYIAPTLAVSSLSSSIT